MKQVIFLLAAVILLCNCNPSADIGKAAAEQTKLKLLKQAGFDKMQKGFTYEYTVQNDSAVAILALIPANNVVDLKEADSAKGILLNVFMTPNGQQYNTTLKRSSGGFYQVAVQTIDGFEIPVYVYLQPNLGGGGGTPPCADNCSAECLQLCNNFYKYNILPGLQKKADSLCKPVRYGYSCPYGAKDPCYDVTAVVLPNSSTCSIVIADPGRIAMSRLENGIIIKNTAAKKNNDKMIMERELSK